MQFSTLILAAIATMASAGTIRRQTDATCPQIDAIPSCGVSPCSKHNLTLSHLLTTADKIESMHLRCLRDTVRSQ